MIIGVQNLSMLVSDDEAYAMTLLANRQARDDVAPAWGMLPPRVTFVPGTAMPSPGLGLDALIGILDDADQAGDLGWHTEGPGARVYGRVFARPVLENGGNALTDGLSVCSVLSHECIEVLGDPACNRWAQSASGTLVAVELADPVESDSYRITIDAGAEKVTGTVSDFALPGWFDPADDSGKTDHCGLTTAPFEVRATGYVIVMDDGQVSEKWGREYPAWRRATKQSPARTSRRNSSVIPAGAPTSLA
jgi:hypothetical protein